MVYHGLIMVYHHRTIYHFVPINVRIWGYAPFSRVPFLEDSKSSGAWMKKSASLNRSFKSGSINFTRGQL